MWSRTKATAYRQITRIIVAYQGVMTRNDCALATRRAIELSASSGVRCFLVDVREASIQISAGDIYSIPAMWDHGGMDRASAMAMLIADDPDMRRDTEFYENTCRNRGWNVQVFDDPDAAAGWLLAHAAAAGNAASG